ncbi:hypothetical protein MKX03_010499 [Papaver bracteatum]|nr:hypothetical protein MKX03_010499 [Papaver bracteatum]
MTLDENSLYMLEPVNGLICFVTGGGPGGASVLIYNPSTRQKTPWIKTLTSAAFRNLFSATLGIETPTSAVLRNLRSATPEHRWVRITDFPAIRFRPSYEYRFGFGMDPSNNKFKVVCIIEVTQKRIIGDNIVSREWICAVFTVGDNTWTKIEQVPPENAIGKDCVHVCGSIYWMSDKNLQRSQNGVIMVFDLVSETFRLIEIPNFIPRSIKRISVVHELAKIDGKLAFLVREGHDLLSLWLYTVNGTGDWIQETMQLPYACRWKGIHNLAFRAVAGTSLVVIKISRQAHESNKFHSEFLYYYDRREKKFYGNQSVILWEPARTCGVTYSITPFYDTLFPV